MWAAHALWQRLWRWRARPPHRLALKRLPSALPVGERAEPAHLASSVPLTARMTARRIARWTATSAEPTAALGCVEGASARIVRIKQFGADAKSGDQGLVTTITMIAHRL